MNKEEDLKNRHIQVWEYCRLFTGIAEPPFYISQYPETAKDKLLD